MSLKPKKHSDIKKIKEKMYQEMLDAGESSMAAMVPVTCICV